MFIFYHSLPCSNLLGYHGISGQLWSNYGAMLLIIFHKEELIRFLKSFFEKHIKYSLCFVTNIEIKD